MKKIFSRCLSILVVVVMLLGMLSISAGAYSPPKSTSTVKGNLGNSYGSVCNVYTSGSKAKLRICTFNQAGNRKSGKVTVKAVSDSGATYTWNVTGCNGISESSTNITLPAGNTHYKVYLRRNGTSNSNVTNTCYVSIDFKSNCWHY